MPDKKTIQLIDEQLFTTGPASVFAVLDGAACKGLIENFDKWQPEHYCLFSGQLPPDVIMTAPHIVALKRDDPFTCWVIEEGWGNHFGIFVRAVATAKEMRRHFRTFLRVRDPEGKAIFFRYYDPRVFRIYLPTCNNAEAQHVFGPIESYLMEDEDDRIMLQMTLGDDAPSVKRIAVDPTLDLSHGDAA